MNDCVLWRAFWTERTCLGFAESSASLVLRAIRSLIAIRTLGIRGCQAPQPRPYRHANQIPFQLESAIVRLRTEHPSWGAAKIQARAEAAARFLPWLAPGVPAKSTVHAVLDRNGLVERRKRRRNKAQGTSLSDPKSPNQLWCTDFKGEFMLGNRQYCYPLTITDYSSRYLLACESLESTKSTFAFNVF